jgi:hypothetical protein
MRLSCLGCVGLFGLLALGCDKPAATGPGAPEPMTPPKADEAKAETPKADEAKEEVPKADEAKPDEAKAGEAKADEAKADEAKPGAAAPAAAPGPEVAECGLPRLRRRIPDGMPEAHPGAARLPEGCGAPDRRDRHLQGERGQGGGGQAVRPQPGPEDQAVRDQAAPREGDQGQARGARWHLGQRVEAGQAQDRLEDQAERRGPAAIREGRREGGGEARPRTSPS